MSKNTIYSKACKDVEGFQKMGELEEYLYHLIQKDTDSLSFFKHLVYGLRSTSSTYLALAKNDT